MNGVASIDLHCTMNALYRRNETTTCNWTAATCCIIIKSSNIKGIIKKRTNP